MRAAEQSRMALARDFIHRFSSSPVHQFSGSPASFQFSGSPVSLYTSSVTKLTVTVITRNEGPHIAAALESVAWADEIVVVDSGSTDDTSRSRERYATRVERHRDWTGYGAQKNYAAGLASHDWILSIDADERVTPALADEIRALLAQPPRPPAT